MARERGPGRSRGRAAERPRRYEVVLLCALETSPGMMLRLLRNVFNLTSDKALQLMLDARQTGASAIAVYTQEVAETKAKMAMDFAARERQPVTLRVEPAE